jgi:hypothetical protein
MHGFCCRSGVATEGGYFGPGSGLTLLDDVRCQGTESSISQCRHRGWGISNCEHSEDVGVICDAPATTASTTTVDHGSGTCHLFFVIVDDMFQWFVFK